MPEYRTRPSLLTPAAGLLSCINYTVTSVLGDKKAEIMLYGAEKAIQDENDEQLRTINRLTDGD